MCTLIILRRPNHDWPVLLAANRDEMSTRAWDPPARHWPDRPNVVAGIDRCGWYLDGIERRGISRLYLEL